MPKRFPFRILILAGLLTSAPISSAETALVAVASNFTQPMTEIAQAFAKASGHQAKLSFGSSGKFVAQFQNGAPFEVFLSADEDKPLALEQTGMAVKGSRMTYALGKLVLWSAKPDYIDDQGRILGNGDYKHLALADPKLAPYGQAALQVIENLDLKEKIQPLLVQGENITQTHQLIATGNAELGFIAFSQVIDNDTFGKGSGWIVPSSLYRPIRQDAVLLTRGADNSAARGLIQFLKSSQARSIIRRYGYDLPQQ